MMMMMSAQQHRPQCWLER